MAGENPLKLIRNSFLFALLLSLCLVWSVHAQQGDLTISMRRDFGYSSGGADIQGLFSVTASAPAKLTKVAFYVDQTLIGEVTQEPYRLQFNTDNYPLGMHQIYAIGTTWDGFPFSSRILNANFVSASESWQTAMKIAIPILGISLLAVLFAAVIPLVTGLKTQMFPVGVQLSYPLGGAICPKCGSPFAIHIYGLNMLTHKYDRCPYCGKWSMVKFASTEKLRVAEQLQWSRANEKAQVPEMTPEEKFKIELDDSKYHDV